MSETRPNQEPSIEEILASIRRIISDDTEEGAAAAPPHDAPGEPATMHQPDEDVLELTEEAPGAHPDPFLAPAPPAEPEPMLAPEPQSVRAEPPPAPYSNAPDGIVSDGVAQAATLAMAKFANNVREEPQTVDPMHVSGRALEDIVREMLRPLLRDWLDQNLPAMVERLVERELRRMSRQVEGP